MTGTWGQSRIVKGSHRLEPGRNSLGEGWTTDRRTICRFTLGALPNGCEAQIQGGSVLENVNELARVEEEGAIVALVEEYTGRRWRTYMQLHDEELMQGQAILLKC